MTHDRKIQMRQAFRAGYKRGLWWGSDGCENPHHSGSHARRAWHNGWIAGSERCIRNQRASKSNVQIQPTCATGGSTGENKS